MIIKINGIYLADSPLDYERIHQIVEDNAYDSIGGFVIDKVQNTEWYQQTNDFNIFENLDGVKNLCQDDAICWMDAVNRSMMEISEPTKMVYRFITHRAGIIKDGFTNNFLPEQINLDVIFNFVDWHFILDCISWFF